MNDVDFGGLDPASATDVPGFIRLLNQLRVDSGEPSYRSLARAVGPLMRPPRVLAASTISDMFQAGRRRLDLDLVVAIVRVLTADEPTVDRWRKAYLRIRRDATAGDPAGVTRQLPADLATFVGREAGLRHVTEAAIRPADEGRAATVVVTAIEGMAGVGKTQLAVHAAHRLVKSGRYVDAQLYANLRGFDPDRPPADPAAVLEMFLRQLKVPAAHVPAGLDERAAMFRDRLDGQRALVLLDNAANETQIRPLIPASPTCLVLITSRRSLAALEGARTITLDVLDTAESIELLARIVGADRVAAEPRAAARIAELCGGLPLAVSLAAARLRSRPAWTLDHLAGRLGRGLDEIAVGDQGLGRVFDLSYQGLPEAARHVFRLLGVHPALDFTASSITALAGVDLGEAERILELLQDERLVQQKVLDRYELHDLLRAYAAERAAEIGVDERSEAVVAVLDWYVVTASAAVRLVNPHLPLPFPRDDVPGERVRFRDGKQALAWYERERPNLLRIFSTASTLGYEHVIYLAPVISRFEQIHRSFREPVRLLRAALPHARQYYAPEAEIQLLTVLGFNLSEDNRPEEALSPLEEALVLTHRHKDLVNEQLVLNAMAVAYTAMGDHGRGLEVGLQAVGLRDHAEVRHSPRTMAALNTVATCLHELGRADEAAPYLAAAIDAARVQNDQVAEGTFLHNLGFIHLNLEHFDEAVTAFKESVTMANKVGNRYIHADCLNGIARAMHARGFMSAAQEFHRQALAVFDDLPRPEADRYREQLDTSPLRYPPA